MINGMLCISMPHYQRIQYHRDICLLSKSDENFNLHYKKYSLCFIPGMTCKSSGNFYILRLNHHSVWQYKGRSWQLHHVIWCQYLGSSGIYLLRVLSKTHTNDGNFYILRLNHHSVWQYKGTSWQLHHIIWYQCLDS